MEGRLMMEIGKRIDEGKRSALVVLTRVSGSSPGREGDMMLVYPDGSIDGTVGGGALEGNLILEAVESIKGGKNKEISYSLGPDGDLKMMCGGSVRGYIKVFKEREKLVIAGGGHIGYEVYELGKFLNMHVAVFDDREEFANRERFSRADEIYQGNIEENLKNYRLDRSSYVVIVTKGHSGDREALRAVGEREVGYVGMIGSRAKIKESYDILVDEGITKDSLNKVYAPVGLDICNGDPKEIAMSIVAEILKVKNNRSGKSMKEVKGIEV